ncbi:MAG: DUF5317 domain-containing protein [Chloroflexi bacterium]|nr:DUF5317 domain-containing protein [Chloroflexota bacterium]
MILLTGIALGVAVGLGAAARHRARYEAPALQYVWVVPVALLLQAWEQSAEFPIIASQLILLAFAFLNRSQRGMKVLLAGAAMNFLVMASNGGYMPISPQTASRLFPQLNMQDYPPGTLFGAKDVLLPPELTRFEWLADRFLPPAWLPYQAAFSAGDVFIAIGACWLFAFPTNPPPSEVQS